MKKFIFYIILLSVVILNPQQARGQLFFKGNPLLGKQAPDFTLQTLSGKDVNMAEFRDGNSAIIFFWATWCPYCRKELEDFDQKIVDMQKKNIKIVLVNVGETPKQVRSFIDKNNINLEVFLDQDSSLSQKYGIAGIPTFFFVDKAGVIKAMENALPDNYGEILLEK